MKDPYQQLLLSALALVNDTDLITHFEAANAYSASPLIACVNDGLEDAVCSSGVDDEPERDMYELYPEDHPEISVLLPVENAPERAISPIVTWVHGLSRKSGELLKN